MSAQTAVSREQAQAVLDAVKAKYRIYFEPMKFEDGFVLDPTYGPDEGPVLLERDGFEVCWEDGPDDWAYQFTAGGSTEEERVLFAGASQEFGTWVKPAEPKPGKVPAGVRVEPATSYSIGVYPA